MFPPNLLLQQRFRWRGRRFRASDPPGRERERETETDREAYVYLICYFGCRSVGEEGEVGLLIHQVAKHKAGSGICKL